MRPIKQIDQASHEKINRKDADEQLSWIHEAEHISTLSKHRNISAKTILPRAEALKQ